MFKGITLFCQKHTILQWLLEKYKIIFVFFIFYIKEKSNFCNFKDIKVGRGMPRNKKSLSLIVYEIVS